MIHKIRALHEEGQGLSIRAIGQEPGISRNPVRKYLRQEVASIEAAQSNRELEKKLDIHRDYIIYLQHPRQSVTARHRRRAQGALGSGATRQGAGPGP